MEKHEGILSEDSLRRLKEDHDTTGNEALHSIHEIHKQKHPGKWYDYRLDRYAILEAHRSEGGAIGRFWDEMHTIPPWVDWAQLERGQRVFYRYGLANLVGFAIQGFMGENAATPSIAEVLVRTGGFSTKVVLQRALETFQWLLQVTRSIEGIKPRGEGHVSTARIRLLHAHVRERMTQHHVPKADYFNTRLYGFPISRLDDIHSIALFACNPMWLQLPVMGIHPKPQEIADYIALFRYLGYLLAVPDEFFSSPAQARLTMDVMIRRERRPTATSQILCHNFVEALRDRAPYRISVGFIEAGARVINGDEMTDAEGLGRSSLVGYASFRGFCWLCQLFVFLQKIFPAFDSYMIQIQSKLFYERMIEGPRSAFSLGRPSKFPVKYKPDLNQMTTKEPAERSIEDRKFFFRPLETLFIFVFLVRCGTILVVSAVGALVAYKILGVTFA